MKTNGRLWRPAMVGVLALLIPACAGDITVNFLFMDTFDGTFPGTAWTTTGTATAVKDVLNGHPQPPSLRISTAAPPDAVAVKTTASFSNPNVTISVHMAAAAAAGEVGVGTIKILDNLSTVVASVSWNEGTHILTVMIAGTTDTIAAPDADLVFHRMAFRVASGGTATWSMDNGPLLTQAAFPASLLTIELGGTYAAGPGHARFYFDNVNVTSP